MALLKLKKSSVTGKVPLITDLDYGEIALNYADGIIYYKTATNTIGTIAAVNTTTNRNVVQVTATNNQINFTITGGYTPGYIDVYLNGVLLDNSDYTATDGSIVVLSSGAYTGDILRFIVYQALSLTTSQFYTKTEVDQLIQSGTTNLSTTTITEGTNLYYTTARANTDFDTRLGTKSTTNLTEGSNLYYTQTRFDTAFSNKSTTNLTEGTNLYYTTVRANTDFDTRLGTKSTTNLTEGSNLYYTQARFDTAFSNKSTTNLTEGTNLYYTTVRANTDFDTRLGTKSTTNLTEGSNLYYTQARFDTAFSNKSTTNLTEGSNLYYTQTRFDTAFSNKSTTNLTEGTNLYYTDSRARNALSFTAGSGGYNTSTGIISIPTNTSQLTNGAGFLTAGSALGTPTSGILSNCTVDGTDAVGFKNVPQNSQSGNYTLVITDSGKHIYHPVGASAATYTIPAASSVAFPLGTVITFVNLAITNVTIDISSDSLYWMGSGSTGTRTLAPYGSASILKVSGINSAGVWIISGSGLT
jgi:hypothetical protein